MHLPASAVLFSGVSIDGGEFFPGDSCIKPVGKKPCFPTPVRAAAHPYNAPTMFQFLQYYARYQGFRSSLGGLPAWGRALLFLLALPGLLLMALSILALVVSILALLLLTLPVYRLLSGAAASDQATGVDSVEPPDPFTGRRHVDVTIIEDSSEPQPRKALDADSHG